MPGKFKPKRMRRVRRNRKIKRSRTTLVNNSALRPFASRFITKMKYSTTLSDAGTGAPYFFNLNSIHDPDRTGVGHQPYGHDSMEAIYNRYRVISCSYVVTAYNAGSPLRFAVIPSNTATSLGNVSTVCENPRARFAIQYPGGNTKMIKGKCYIPALVGRNKTQYMSDDDYQAAFGSSPNEVAVLGIYSAGTLDGPLNGTSITVTLEYTVECYDVRILPVS